MEKSRRKEPSADVKSALLAAATESGVPYRILEAVAYAESRFNAAAESPAGAQGLMQLMPSVSQKYGVEDPYDVRDNARAGALVLSKLYKTYRNWPRAFAAYNWGMGNLALHPEPSDWPDETKGYILAIYRRLGRHSPFRPTSSMLPKNKQLEDTYG